IVMPSKMPLPHKAATYAEWVIREGGLQAVAWTDVDGTPYLAVKTLNRIGKTTGLYDWHRGDSFESDMVAGFIDGRPLVMRVHVAVTAEGLTLTVRLPPECGRNFEEKI